MTIKAYQVGGHVRDTLLGLKSKDVDYAVEAPSYEAMVDWIKLRGKIFLESPDYFTVRAHLEGKQPADYVLCRKDGTYSDGRRPDFVLPGTILDDLARRDFTINAIAYDEDTKQYIDPFGGRSDLTNAKDGRPLLRCVGSAFDRFREDALRMLRAMRFIITKDCAAHDSVWEALLNPAMIELLSTKISMERKREELRRCFAHDTVYTMEWLQNAGYRFIEAVFNGKTGKLWLEPTNKLP